MTCAEARDLFSALIDEALTPDEGAALDRHLAGCAECREELQRFRSTVSLVRAIEPERAPVGFVDRVLARTGPVPWYRRLVRWLVFPLPVKLPLGAAAAVLVGVLVSLLYRQSSELQQAARQGPTPAPPAVEAPAAGQTPASPVVPRTPAPGEDAARSPDARLAKQTPPEPAAPMKDKREQAARDETASEGEAATGIASGKVAVAPREPDLAGRLTVADLGVAERAFGSLVSRSGGQETSRRQIPDGLEVEVSIPRVRADEFTRGLPEIGRWQAARAVESPGDPVRLRIQLVR
jgi:hypothetical protein